MYSSRSRRAVPLTDFERLVVDEPLDPHAVVADWLQAALEVHVRALHRLHIAQRLGERRHLRNGRTQAVSDRCLETIGSGMQCDQVGSGN